YWSHYLADRGFKGIYETHLVYGPAYLYLLLISGEIASFLKVGDFTHEVLIKFWPTFFDFLGGFLIYLIGRQQKKQNLGFWLGVFYILNPAVFINSSIWGQFDSLLATVLFAVVYSFVARKQILGIILYTIAILTKPQSILLFPLVAYLFLFRDTNWKKIFHSRNYWLKLLTGGISAILTYVILVLPVLLPIKFSKKEIIELFLWLPRLYLKYVNDYPYATANGFNLWTILGGQVTFDSNPFFGLTYAGWSKILIVVLWGYLVWFLIKDKHSPFSLFYVSYLLAFGFFMFWTRMHERYLVPAIIFLTVCILWDSSLWLPALILSMSVMINQAYMYELAKRDIYWLAKDDILALFIASISLIVFIYSLFYLLRYVWREKSKS
ncbi:MAG: hypothetical protein ACPL1D_02180, partial [Microgenomates group bacterium]